MAGAKEAATEAANEADAADLAALEQALAEAYAKGVEDGKTAAPAEPVYESGDPTAWIRHSSGQVWEVERGSETHRRLIGEGHVEVPAPDQASESA